MIEVTDVMELAGVKAVEKWHAGGQSGPVQRAIYCEMLVASGAKEAEIEQHLVKFDETALAAGLRAEEVWLRTPPEGDVPKAVSRPVVETFRAIHAVVTA